MGSEPVWRLSISANTLSNPANDVFRKIKDHPDTQLLTPTGTNRSMLAGEITIDRYVWFSKTIAPPPAMDPNTGLPVAGPTRNNTFYVRDSALSAAINPGGYLVVGPRNVTAMGSTTAGSGSQKWGVPSPQQIVLQPAGGPAVSVSDLDGDPNPTVPVPNGGRGNALPPPANSQETAAIWVAMDPPASWGSWNASWAGKGTAGIGLNVSEPLPPAYYPCPTHKNIATGLHDAYGPLQDSGHTSFLNTPVDRNGGCPIADGLLSPGTCANFCTVFVERLADPTRPHDPDPNNLATWNPYIAIDFMPVDLTVFNGESSAPDPSETQGRDRGLAAALPFQTDSAVPQFPADPVDPSKVPLPIFDATRLRSRLTHFHTRQRGFGSDLPGYDNDGTLFGIGDLNRNPHPYKPLGSLADVAAIPFAADATTDSLQPGGKPTTPRPAGGSGSAFFMHELGQGPAGRGLGDWTRIPYHSLGWVNPAFGRRLDVADGIPVSYFGCPDRPFPWIVWNDRPFANPFELIFVPRTPASRLFTNYRNPDAAANASDMFGATAAGAHLLPFTAITDVPTAPAGRSRNADFFIRLFEYVRVRSPFTGTETVLSGIGNDGRPDRFVGPFNRLPTYREPGRININTIHPDPAVGAPVWNALCAASQGPATPSYADIVSARSIRLPFASNAATFARPYRIARGNRTDFAAPDFQVRSNALFAASWLTNPPGFTGGLFVNSGTAAPLDDIFSARSFTLFGDRPRAAPLPATRPLLFPAPPADAWANDGDRNAWFRFESLVRANANATVRSEVYAIWVTMGLFEVEQESNSVLYPDGWRLVREHGSDTGDVTRHRGFYIFDRSLPVGFTQGDDLNVQDGILVERPIE
jgi:hypothetical protein